MHIGTVLILPRPHSPRVFGCRVVLEEQHIGFHFLCFLVTGSLVRAQEGELGNHGVTFNLNVPLLICKSMAAFSLSIIVVDMP